MAKPLILAPLVLALLASVPLSGQETSKAAAHPSVSISLKKGDAAEMDTKRQLERLISVYDVSPWIFTDKVLIDGDPSVIPHSHPVLTLSVRHLKDDELLLATFLHENLHWWMEAHSPQVDKAITELKVLFPKVPVGYPEGAQDEPSTYLHLLVCKLEYEALKPLLGELRARQVMDFWATDHYTWIYRTVLERGWDLRGVVKKNGLDPRVR